MSSSTSALPEATATSNSNPYNIDIPTASQIPSSSLPQENKSDNIDFDKPIIIKKL
jgi:hypothetical protein